MAGPQTQFVQSFMEECVECLEQGSRGSILQFMPFTMVSYERGGGGQAGGDKEEDEWLLNQTLLETLWNFFQHLVLLYKGSLGFVGAYNQEIVHVAFWKRQMK